MKAWPFIRPVSSRYNTGGPASRSNRENSATSWATEACALRFFKHNTYNDTRIDPVSLIKFQLVLFDYMLNHVLPVVAAGTSRYLGGVSWMIVTEPRDSLDPFLRLSVHQDLFICDWLNFTRDCHWSH